ncbi:hypothetical protein Hamer_G023125 [Homarus americanus]|uniref:Uncharacterized protein n=1 Tax=Homarus americanus TaxID=6706 RepID=A0A8J5MS46_HOMAM|nr:hypothetical protein Hamer_G023125 [Homarus americanus]
MRLRRIRRYDAGLYVRRPTGLVRYRVPYAANCRQESKVGSLYSAAGRMCGVIHLVMAGLCGMSPSPLAVYGAFIFLFEEKLLDQEPDCVMNDIHHALKSHELEHLSRLKAHINDSFNVLDTRSEDTRTWPVSQVLSNFCNFDSLVKFRVFLSAVRPGILPGLWDFSAICTPSSFL